MSYPSPCIEADLLYPKAPKLDLGGVEYALNKALRGHGHGQMTLVRGKAGTLAILTGTAVHVCIAKVDAKDTPDAFAKALAAPVNAAKSRDFARTINRHRTRLSVSIHDSDAPGAARTAPVAALARKFELLHLVCQAVHDQARADAIYFGPSGMLVTPSELRCLRDVALPVPLLLHPVPHPLQTGPGGQIGFGLRAEQSHLLIGKTLELEGVPQPVPMSLLLTLLSRLITEYRAGRLPLAHGDTLSEAEGMKLHIRHQPGDADDPEGRIIASFWDHQADGSSERARAAFAFQDRVARIQSRAPFGPNPDSLPAPDLSGLVHLRSKVSAPPKPPLARRFMPQLVLSAAAMLLIYSVFSALPPEAGQVVAAQSAEAGPADF